MCVIIFTKLSIKMTDTARNWILRHVGPRSSIANAVDVVRLSLGATTFGRGADSDVCIDSMVLLNFISRSHAKVIGTRGINGQIEFTLHDTSLNGTYVNDIRMNVTQRLTLGDKVVFGHRNGVRVKRGEFSPQTDSEFQFMVEQFQTNAADACHRHSGDVLPDDGSSGDLSVQHRLRSTDTVSSPSSLSAVSSDVQQCSMVTGVTAFNQQSSSNPVCCVKRSDRTGLIHSVDLACERSINGLFPASVPCSYSNSYLTTDQHNCKGQMPSNRSERRLGEVFQRRPSCFDLVYSTASSSFLTTHMSDGVELENDVSVSNHAVFPEHVPHDGVSNLSDYGSDLSLPMDRCDKDDAACLSHSCPSPSKQRTGSEGVDCAAQSSVKGLVGDYENECGVADERSRSPAILESVASWSHSVNAECIYDEPPILTPVCGVRTPFLRTPSPDMLEGKVEDVEWEVDNASEADKLLSRIPLTPGCTFPDLSPTCGPAVSADTKAGDSVTKNVYKADSRLVTSSTVSRRTAELVVMQALGTCCSDNHLSGMSIPSPRSRHATYDTALLVQAPLGDPTSLDCPQSESFMSPTMTKSCAKLDTCSEVPPHYSQSSPLASLPASPLSPLSLPNSTPHVSSVYTGSVSHQAMVHSARQHTMPVHSQSSAKPSVKDSRFVPLSCKENATVQSSVNHQLQMAKFSLPQRDPQNYHCRKDLAIASQLIGGATITDSQSLSDSSAMQTVGRDACVGVKERVGLCHNVAAAEYPTVGQVTSCLTSTPDNADSRCVSRYVKSVCETVVETVSSLTHTQPVSKRLNELTGNMHCSEASKNLFEKFSGIDEHLLNNKQVPDEEDKRLKTVMIEKGNVESTKHISEKHQIGRCGRSESNCQPSLCGQDVKLKDDYSAKMSQSMRTSDQALGKVCVVRQRGRRRKHKISPQLNRGQDQILRKRRLCDLESVAHANSQLDSGSFELPALEDSEECLFRSRSPKAVRCSRFGRKSHRVTTPMMPLCRHKDELKIGCKSAATGHRTCRGKAKSLTKKACVRGRRMHRDDNDDDGDWKDDRELEDGVTWYENDTCESTNCFRPSDRLVQWVQCDDCDLWYHTMCVGVIDLNHLEHEEFHCGCG